MAHKRSCEDQLPNDVSSKHPRQTGDRDLDVTHVDMHSLKPPSGKDIHSGEESLMVNSLEGPRNICANGSTPGLPDDEEDKDTGITKPHSLFPWAAAASSASEEPHSLFRFDRLVNSPLRAAASPSPLRAENLHSVLDNPPRKSVPVGPDHQADIDIPLLSKTDEYCNELAGNSIIPKDDSDSELPHLTEGTGRKDCECLDTGSVRCVRQHIAEARENLLTSLGEEAFLELGFREMGEVVSEKWSKDEEQLFHKVVQCNPFSVGNNFWKVLSAVFPSRTKMEIVSYYFNVLMLQKRAEQNRHDPTNIDSDNDEWQLRDGGFESTDDEEENDSNDHSDYPVEYHDASSKFSCDLASIENNHHGFSDPGPPSGLLHGSPECGRVWQDFAWDDFATCSKDELDFLPTCSMIQEVFGDGPLDSDAKRR